MPIIKFQAADFLATKVIEPGTYPSEISKIEGPTKSSSGKSYSYFVDVTVTDGPYKGKTRTLAFNTETRSYSLLSEAQFYPDASLLELDQAINGSDATPREYELDTDNLLHKPFDTTWGVATNEGHLFNIITAFHKAGYAASAPAF